MRAKRKMERRSTDDSGNEGDSEKTGVEANFSESLLPELMGHGECCISW